MCIGFVLGITNPSHCLFYCAKKIKVLKKKQYLNDLAEGLNSYKIFKIVK